MIVVQNNDYSYAKVARRNRPDSRRNRIAEGIV